MWLRRRVEPRALDGVRPLAASRHPRPKHPRQRHEETPQRRRFPQKERPNDARHSVVWRAKLRRRLREGEEGEESACGPAGEEGAGHAGGVKAEGDLEA
jgi:hypothetical protein